MRINNQSGAARLESRSRVLQSATATLLLLFGGASPAAAQDETEARTATWFKGLSVGIPGHAGTVAPGFFTVGLHGAEIQHRRPGLDYSVGTMPRALIHGLIVLGARAGVVVPLELSEDVLLLPSAGGSFIGGIGQGGGGFEFGGNIGAGMLMLSGGTRGLRVGVTWHRFGVTDGAVWLVEFGFVRSG